MFHEGQRKDDADGDHDYQVVSIHVPVPGMTQLKGRPSVGFWMRRLHKMGALFGQVSFTAKGITPYVEKLGVEALI